LRVVAVVLPVHPVIMVVVNYLLMVEAVAAVAVA